MSFGVRTDEIRTELVVEVASDPLQAIARLAGSGLFAGHVVYERPGTWTFAGGVLGEVILEPGTVRTRWADGAETARPWTGRPAAALRDAFAEAPWPAWNAYGWVAFEFSCPQAAAPGQRLAHLVVPRAEVRIEAGHAVVTGVDSVEVEQVGKLLADTTPYPVPAPAPVDVRVADDYRERVAKALEEIGAGLYQKVIVSRRLPIGFPVDVLGTFLNGRAANTPARSFLLDLDGFQATGFSPEVVAQVCADGRVMTQPLAGTRAFGLGADADTARRRELESDPKEIFEHAVSVRTSQEELYGVCDPDTVQVTGFMTIKERGSVQHLGSSVHGRLAPGRSPWDAFEALFPAVTASGIPKPEAVDAITRLDEPRGLYSGAVLTLSHDGSLDAALVLRALYSSGGRAWLRAGAGIVTGSTPDREYEETCEKLSSVAPYVVRSR
ncbi:MULTISPECIES: salicylate synthase [Thermomonospora]|uniref:Salicylate synthetase n=1 Tax=Thermomonospora cellulosilytica TaxID=1411118 RepID=A0A7W3MVE3_9ACTN|nr:MULTISPECIES: salicylate synthase [Thermomonospora]MBA9002619.1 salicylate synthetase [Thermomonospora cellulosilytica]